MTINKIKNDIVRESLHGKVRVILATGPSWQEAHYETGSGDTILALIECAQAAQQYRRGILQRERDEHMGVGAERLDAALKSLEIPQCIRWK